MTQEETNRAEWENPGNWRGPAFVALYVSPADTRIVVRKRVPILGWTLNVGRPAGRWLATAIVAALCVLIALPSLQTLRQMVREKKMNRELTDLAVAMTPLLGPTDIALRRTLDRHVSLCDADHPDGVTLAELNAGTAFLPAWKGEGAVVRAQPFSPEKPSVIDFSAVTGAGKGVFLLRVRGEKDHDCVIVVKVDGEERLKAAATGNEWGALMLPFDGQSIVLEGHGGGPDGDWDHESLRFSYKIVVDKR